MCRTFFVLMTSICLVSTRDDFSNNKFQQIKQCITPYTSENVQLMMDYARWRNVGMLYILDESINSGCNLKAIKQHLDCFLNNGISVALHRHLQSYWNFSVTAHAKKLMVVSFIRPNMNVDHYKQKINLLATSHDSLKWLLIYTRSNDSSNVTDFGVLNALRTSPISLSLDMVLAVSFEHSRYLNKTGGKCKCDRNGETRGSSDGLHTLLPFKNGSANVTFRDLCGKIEQFCVLQVYKIRKVCNNSLVVRQLGAWSYEKGVRELRSFQNTENRIDFYGFPLTFGRKQNDAESHGVLEENQIEDYGDDANLDKIAEFITLFLNATRKMKTYPSLGVKSATGNWTGLLGAVVSQEVDIGLDAIMNKLSDSYSYSDISFTRDIMISVRNIYLKPQPSHTARDIFLAPFEPNLIWSILGTGIVLAVAMTVYISVMRIPSGKSGSNFPPLSDALLWMAGVFTMQGSLIKPRSYSGNIIVVISLVYALIIYNAYSAFITSILSVKLPEIRTVRDLLNSDYDIGYAKNSHDEIFLRKMNESQLNEIYLRGFLHNNIHNITEGLLRAIKGNYGFFASRHEARKQFLNISGYKCRYEIAEMTVKSTENTIGFPMSASSPYRKVVDICLIKMSENGVHRYINGLMAPKLPKCEQKITYQSARLNDVITSFALIGLGITLAVVVGLMECLWKRRKNIWARVKGGHMFYYYNQQYLP